MISMLISSMFIFELGLVSFPSDLYNIKNNKYREMYFATLSSKKLSSLERMAHMEMFYMNFLYYYLIKVNKHILLSAAY